MKQNFNESFLFFNITTTFILLHYILLVILYHGLYLLHFQDLEIKHKII